MYEIMMKCRGIILVGVAVLWVLRLIKQHKNKKVITKVEIIAAGIYLIMMIEYLSVIWNRNY